MTSTLLRQVERLRCLAILLLAVCGFATSHAQTAATSSEINEALASESSAALTWTNDATYPWYLTEDDGGTQCLRISEPAEGTEYSSTLSFSYSSSYVSDIRLSFKHNYRHLEILLDDEMIFSGSDYKFEKNGIPAGDHTVQIIVSATSDPRYVFRFYEVRVKEYKPLESECLKSGSMPLTFENDATNPWVCGNGFVQSRQIDPTTKKSKISTTFTIDAPTLFSFDEYHSSYNYTTEFNLYIDGAKRTGNSFVLNAGTHTVEFEMQYSMKFIEDYGFDDTYVRISNVYLSQEWTEVAVNNPGEFVSSLVDVIGDKSILDIEMLKISGSLSDKDWEGIKQMKGLVCVDLTGTDITSIPESQFYGFNKLYTVLLPETLTSIGNRAFGGSGLGEIWIPDSVVSIEGSAFWNCYSLYSVKLSKSLTSISYDLFRNDRSLKSIEIPEGVRYIGDSSFINCGVESIVLPEGVTTIGEYAFASSSLKSIVLPESLISIGDRGFSSCSLTKIVIPKNVTSIGIYAFQECPDLTHVTLNSYANELYNTFSGCGNIETIVVPSVTPPTVANAGGADPFSSVDKDAVTVLVPEFALGTYKVDPYWFLFRNIRSSEEISTSDFWAIHGHLKLNSSHPMTGTPSIEIEAGGILDVAADTPLTLNEVTYSNQESVPAVFLNESDQVTASSLTTKFSVPNSGKWYFFSPVTDVNMADVTYPATNSWVIRYYDGASRAANGLSSGNWVNMPGDGVLKRGQGYIIQAATAGTLIMPAATSQHSAFFGISEAPMTLADNTSEATEHAGWNLVGNPYPTYYDIYSMDLEAPITVWNGSTYRAYSLSDDDFVLRPMQPFFVQKTDADMTLGMPRGGRLGTSAITRSSAPRVNAVDPLRHKLNLEIASSDSEEAADYTRIVINESASLSYEGARDASKFMSLDSEVAQIYSLGENLHPLAINERPYADGNAQLGVYIPQAGSEYRIGASRADRRAWLFDAKTGVEQDLTEGDYIFTADEAGTVEGRFSIRFAPAAGTAVEGIDASAVKVAGGKGVISVSAPAEVNVEVFAADGSRIATAEGSLEVSAAAGVYVVSVDGRGYKVIVK